MHSENNDVGPTCIILLLKIDMSIYDNDWLLAGSAKHNTKH